jgi:hypothetical protein
MSNVKTLAVSGAAALVVALLGLAPGPASAEDGVICDVASVFGYGNVCKKIEKGVDYVRTHTKPVGRPAESASPPATAAEPMPLDPSMVCMTSIGAYELLMPSGSNAPFPGDKCVVSEGSQRYKGSMVYAEPHPVLMGVQCVTPFGKFQVRGGPSGSPCVVDGRMRGWIE